MQAEISSAGGATTTTPKTTVVTNNLSSQPEIVARPITPDNRDVQSASTSVIVASPDQSVVSFSRRREPSEAETMVTTDAVALPLESTANLRHRACSTDKQTLGA